MSTEPEIDWVEVRRFDDAVAADIAMNFLRDHGVTVAVRGNSGTVAVLNRFDTVLDIRVMVPADEIEQARDALHAMDSPDAARLPAQTPDQASDPYRATQRARSAVDDGESSGPARRYPFGALFVAMIFPIGAGHFYARHNVAGQVFAGATLGCFLGGALGHQPWLMLTAVFVVLADALGGFVATTRHNAGRPWSGRTQAIYALAALLLGGVVAYAWKGDEAQSEPRAPTEGTPYPAPRPL